MGPPLQSARPSYLPIHFSTVFDGRAPVLCRSPDASTPATSDWRYVTCRRCLVAGAVTSAVAHAELERRDSEREAWRHADEDGADTDFDIRRAGRLDDPAFAAHLTALGEERMRIGHEISTRMAGARRVAG